MSQLYIYKGALKKYYYFDDQIKKRVDEGISDYLAILPVNRAVRLFKKSLLDSARGNALIDPPIFTFDQVLLKLYENLPSRKRIINSDMQLFMVEELLRSNFRELKYLPAKDKIPGGLVKKTSDMINELRRFGYSSSNFDDVDLADLSENQLKLNDFKLLLSKLEELLGDNLIDEAFAMHTAAKLLDEKSFKRIFPQTRCVYISGYGLFTPAMYEFIGKIRGWCPVHIKIEYVDHNQDLFRHTSTVISRLEVMGAQVEDDLSPGPLALRLFNRGHNEEIKSDLNNRVEVQPLTNRRDEVAFMAAKARDLHRNKNIPLEKIAVTFSDMERYVPLIRQVFSEHGIPFNLSTGYSLNQSPLILAFLNTLRLVESGFEYQKVFDLLNSNLIYKKDPIDTIALYKLIVENRIKYLRPGWQDKISKKQNYKSGKDIFSEIDKLNGFISSFLLIPQKANIAEFRSHFIKLLKTYGLLTWYTAENKYLTERQKEKEFRAFNRFMKLFDKFIWTMEFLSRGKPITLDVFIRHLQTAVERASFNLTEWPGFGVQIMPRLEIQALDFDVLMIGGLVDGDFPRSSSKDIFFSDPVRARMGLVAAEELLDQDRFMFYNLLDSGADSIILTYPKYEGERALVTSTFVSELADIANIKFADIPDETYLYSPNSLWEQIGLKLQQNKITGAEEAAKKLVSMSDETGGWTRHDLKSVLSRMGQSRKRITANGFSVFEGNLESISSVTEELSEIYKDFGWSISSLEDYAFCPMFYYLKRKLKIEETPEFEEEMTSLERGNTVHEILYRFYSELVEKGEQMHPSRHRERLFQIAEEVFAALPFHGFFWDLEKKRYFGLPDSKGLLDVFLEHDQDQIEQTGFAPALLEYSFGYTGDSAEDKSSVKTTVRLENDKGSIRLSGKLDRADINSKDQILIFDYKTGTKAEKIKAKQILNGISFQLPFYILALQKLKPELDPVYAGYFQVKDADNCKRIPVMADKNEINFDLGRSNASLPNKKVTDDAGNEMTFNELLEHSLATAVDKVEELKNGMFRHTMHPGEYFCKSLCEYRRMCQKNAAKLNKMAGRDENNEDE
ncbi:MAG: PD-(D/E)XK nuclease family protein [Calditrichaceae bacterium]